MSENMSENMSVRKYDFSSDFYETFCREDDPSQKNLPNFSENLRPNLVLAAKILYSIGMKLLS